MSKTQSTMKDSVYTSCNSSGITLHKHTSKFSVITDECTIGLIYDNIGKIYRDFPFGFEVM